MTQTFPDQVMVAIANEDIQLLATLLDNEKPHNLHLGPSALSPMALAQRDGKEKVVQFLQTHESSRTDSLVTKQDLEALFHYFSNFSASSSDDHQLRIIHEKVIALLRKDYIVSTIENRDVELLCNTYPLRIPIIEGDKQSSQSVINTEGLRSLFDEAKHARVRSRFPVPVLLVNGKYVCRSGTLSQKAEIAYHLPHEIPSLMRSEKNRKSVISQVREKDIELLKRLRVTCICDLMVENKRAYYGVKVASSEKTDSYNRYADFRIKSLPYPGVEFFSEWKQLNHSQAETLFFDFASLSEANPFAVNSADHKDLWENYRHLNLVSLSQNYLALFLRLLHSESGILVHCISGWDRTPLFISLLRLSLWADSIAHSSLSVEEMLYLTVAYDWLLFNHQFQDRSSKGQDIFKFCFHLLEKISSDSFAFHNNDNPMATPSNSAILSGTQEPNPVRQLLQLEIIDNWFRSEERLSPPRSGSSKSSETPPKLSPQFSPHSLSPKLSPHENSLSPKLSPHDSDLEVGGWQVLPRSSSSSRPRKSSGSSSSVGSPRTSLLDEESFFPFEHSAQPNTPRNSRIKMLVEEFGMHEKSLGKAQQIPPSSANLWETCMAFVPSFVQNAYNKI